jgi:hypothetical protein
LAGAAGLLFFAGAVATPMTGDPNSDEIFANRSESFIDTAPAYTAAPAVSDAQALTAAVRTTREPAAVEWARASGDALGAWAEPGYRSVERQAARYQPRLSLAPNGDEPGAQVRLEFGRDGRAAAPTARQQSLAQSMRLPQELTDARKQEGRWFLFAGGGGDAFGMNLLRGRPGELRRAGWSAEKIAAVGDAQLGFGWRKGPLQASVAFVEREISAYGKSADERFVAFTFSIRPDSARTGGGQREYWVKKAESYPGRSPKH